MQDVFKVVHMNDGSYYISFVNASNGDFDSSIARFLKIKLESYQNFLVKNYNAKIIGGETYFKSVEDVSAAKEWVDSIVVMNKLSEN